MAVDVLGTVVDVVLPATALLGFQRLAELALGFLGRVRCRSGLVYPCRVGFCLVGFGLVSLVLVSAHGSF